MADTTPASTNETRPRIGSIVDGLVVLAIIALCAVCFANSVSGEFVYDDNIQIASNDLIKNPQLLPKAMVSDVFAFKGDTGKAWSNYWRPTFVAWLALNYWLFGLNPVGWHIGNILLHAAVAIAGYATLRAARLPRPLAIAAVFLFAVHPVHVESVAWISGSTDMLFALPLLGSLWMFLATAQRRTALHWCAMLALYAIALLAKESAIVFPAMVFGVSAMIGRREDAGPFQWRAALRDAIPFALMAGLYLLGRYAVLGKFSGESPWKADPVTILNTAPSVLAFYLRQTFLPLWIGPSYPLRAVGADNIGLFNFVVPVIVVLLVAVIGLLIVRRTGRLGWMGALLLLPLAPAMNVGVFVPEQLVHDRYLYLPLLGALAMTFAAIAALLVRDMHWTPAKAHAACLALAIALCVPLAAKTLQSNRDWTSEENLWTAAVQSDPTSALNLIEYGRVLKNNGRLDEALNALNKAIAIIPLPQAHVQRADVAMLQHRYADAEADLRTVLDGQHEPYYFAAYERLANIAFERKRFDRAVEILREARAKLPYRKCILTDKIAVVLTNANRPDEAVRELESVRADAAHEFGDLSRMPLYRLGILYGQQKRYNEAEQVLRAFVEAARTATHAEVTAARADAQQILSLMSR